MCCEARARVDRTSGSGQIAARAVVVASLAEDVVLKNGLGVCVNVLLVEARAGHDWLVRFPEAKHPLGHGTEGAHGVRRVKVLPLELALTESLWTSVPCPRGAVLP